MTDKGDTLNDAYSYVLALVTTKPDDAISVQGKYGDDKIRDLMGASAGVLLGIFSNTSSELRSKIAASLQYGITGDKSFLESDKADDLPVGQYL